MSLEKLASAKLGKARVREERNSSGGGEGHKVVSKKLGQGHRGREEESLERKAESQWECKKRTPEGVT